MQSSFLIDSSNQIDWQLRLCIVRQQCRRTCATVIRVERPVSLSPRRGLHVVKLVDVLHTFSVVTAHQTLVQIMFDDSSGDLMAFVGKVVTLTGCERQREELHSASYTECYVL